MSIHINCLNQNLWVKLLVLNLKYAFQNALAKKAYFTQKQAKGNSTQSWV